MATYSKTILPEGFVKRMESRLGHESEEFFNSLDAASPVSVRINPLKWQVPRPTDKVPWCSTGYYLENRPSFTLDPWFNAGAYYVQEAGSMLLEQAFRQVPEKKGRLILDMCGAPGGKSTHLLSLINPDDFLVTNEVIRSRAVVLRENIQKWGHSNVLVTCNDPKDFGILHNIFDAVVVDAPCSGEGLFRKDSASVREWSEDNAALCSARQRRILSEAWECLKPGGYLIYSTCTYNPAENEENLAWITQLGYGQPILLNQNEEWNIRTIEYQNSTGYQVFPHLTQAEGFFTGIVRKGGVSADARLPRNHLKKFVPAEIQHSGVVSHWLNNAENKDFLRKGDEIFHLPQEWHPLLALAEKKLNIIQPGNVVAVVKGTKANPHPSLAQSVLYHRGIFPETELNLHEALTYLQKNNLHPEGQKQGWILATYRNIPLGWLKHIGNRTNNYYPPERRIRMSFTNPSEPWHTVF